MEENQSQEKAKKVLRQYESIWKELHKDRSTPAVYEKLLMIEKVIYILRVEFDLKVGE